MKTVIGLLSDTHSYLDPKIPEIFQGVDHILHAGDIGPASLILELENIAPVTAVYGNTDFYLPYPETEVLTLAGRTFLLHHIVDFQHPHTAIWHRMNRTRPDVVVFGHTHKPYAEQKDQTLFINPGYAGKKRFQLPRTVATMELSPEKLSYQWIPL